MRIHLWKNVSLVSFVLLLIGSTTVFAGQTQKGSDIQFYGFLRMDMAYNTSRMSDTQIPVFVLSEDPNAPGAAPENQSEFTLYTRMTRFGLNLGGGEVEAIGSPKLTGRIEVDFYGGPASDSRNMFRMRHAWARLQWGNFLLLAGQTVDLISPLYPFVNADMLMWGTGNLADRRPQTRAEYTLPIGGSQLFIQGAAGLTNAIDRKDLDKNGVPDGEVSGLPTLQGRLALRLPLWKTDDGASHPLEIGAWAHQAWEELDAPLNGTEEDGFQSSVVGVDVKLPLYRDRLTLTAEGWTGKNLSDVRGGILQGINTRTGAEIRATGGFAQLSWTTTKTERYKNILHAGIAMDDPDEEDLNKGGRDLNYAVYGAVESVFGHFTLGIEYLHWVTEYVGFGNGTSDRINLYTVYNF